MIYLIREENIINNYEDDTDLSQIENVINNLRKEVSKQHSITRNSLSYQADKINESLLKINNSINIRNKIEKRKLYLDIKQVIREEIRKLKYSNFEEFYQQAKEIIDTYNRI